MRIKTDNIRRAKRKLTIRNERQFKEMKTNATQPKLYERKGVRNKNQYFSGPEKGKKLTHIGLEIDLVRERTIALIVSGLNFEKIHLRRLQPVENGVELITDNNLDDPITIVLCIVGRIEDDIAGDLAVRQFGRLPVCCHSARITVR